MWFAAIGVGFGFLQYAALNKLVKLLLSKKSQTFLSVAILVGKLMLILIFLLIITNLSGIRAMLWSSLGMLAIMIALPIINGIKNIHTYNKNAVREEK